MKKLKYYGGQGFDFSNEVGKFKVKSKADSKYFDRLSEARIYFKSLNKTKAIWDITTIPELLEAWT